MKERVEYNNYRFYIAIVVRFSHKFSLTDHGKLFVPVLSGKTFQYGCLPDKENNYFFSGKFWHMCRPIGLNIQQTISDLATDKC